MVRINGVWLPVVFSILVVPSWTKYYFSRCCCSLGLRLTFNKLQQSLDDANSAVVSCAVNVITELSDKNPRNYLHLGKFEMQIIMSFSTTTAAHPAHRYVSFPPSLAHSPNILSAPISVVQQLDAHQGGQIVGQSGPRRTATGQVCLCS
jgi:hypothetical protein